MKRDTHKQQGGGVPWIRLIGIGVLAALAALVWTAGGASAQRGPTVKASYEGWAADATAEVASDVRASHFQILDIADNSSPAALNRHWTCPDLGCHYLHVRWSGIPAKPAVDGKIGGYDISLARFAPSPADIGVSESDFELTNVPIAMRMRVADESAREWYVPVPWPGERVTVLVHGHLYGANRVVKVPAASLSARAALSQTEAGATLVTNHVDPGRLPTVMAIWRQIEGATHYEVEYTFRTRSAEQRLTKVTRAVARSQVSDKAQGQGTQTGQTHYQYSAFNANWDQHPNAASLNALTDNAFGDQPTDGQWLGSLTTLGKLLEGAEGWPQSDLDANADADITAALSAGRNAVGVRVRPMLACAAYDNSALCSDNSRLAAPLAVAGQKSRITYVRFRGADVHAWFDSLGYVPTP